VFELIPHDKQYSVFAKVQSNGRTIYPVTQVRAVFPHFLGFEEPGFVAAA